MAVNSVRHGFLCNDSGLWRYFTLRRNVMISGISKGAGYVTLIVLLSVFCVPALQ